jgi:general secretion pathway protein M
MARFAIVERLGRLNPRERRMVTLLGAIAGILVFIGLPAGLEAAVISRQTDASELRAALDAVQSARASIRERQSKKDSITARYARRAPPLAGFISELAKQQKLEITDTVDRAEVPHGKKFSERSTTIHLRKSGMLPIAKLLESIETSNFPVVVSRLNIHKRPGEPDSYDVELGVSAYDKVEAAAAPASSASAGPSQGAKE